VRHRVQISRPRPARFRVVTGVAALLTAITLGFVVVVAGCSSNPVPAPNMSAATPSSATAPLARSVPVRLQVPAIGVDSELMDLGLKADRTLQVPSVGFPAGWYTGAPTPGQLGPAVIAGHVDWDGKPGVFYHLRNLKPGDEISVTRQDGVAAQFRVTKVEYHSKKQFPTGAVYGDLDHAGLRLITCGGSFDPQAHSYEDNIIVFADLTGTRTV
jgi:sortase (surface protein transpeptidase)